VGEVKAASFEYVAATTLDEAVAMIGDRGDEAKVLAGGQSLVPLMVMRLARPEVLIDINGIGGLDHVRVEDRVLRIGALARQRVVELDPGVTTHFPLVTDAVSTIGHVAIRNRGTVGGSIAHADPAAEWPALLMALDGEVDLVSSRGRRTLGADDLFLSVMTTALAPDELILEVRLRLPSGQVGTSFVELARRHGDFAIVGVAAVLGLEGGVVQHCRLALSGVGETAVRARAAEAALVGGLGDDARFALAAQAVADEIQPPGDLQGSADYRRKVASVLVRRALVAARGRIREGRA
jgi:carbon-monoxide dehydrogenase medium subunit